MRVKQVLSFTVICMVLCWIAPGEAQAPRQKTPARLYNTAKQKLREGKQIVGATVFSPDPNMYCAMANAGYDYLWIEMQHSPLTYGDVARMIWACRGASAMPSRKRRTSALWGLSFRRSTPWRRLRQQ